MRKRPNSVKKTRTRFDSTVIGYSKAVESLLTALDSNELVMMSNRKTTFLWNLLTPFTSQENFRIYLKLKESAIVVLLRNSKRDYV